MRKILIVFITFAIGFNFIPTVSAQFNVDKIREQINKEIGRLEKKASTAADNQEKRLSKIKETAGKLIDKRVNDLNKLLTRIENDKKLSTEEKTTLKAGIQASIDGLAALKAKIQADTDIDTAKQDTKTIITSYYVYKIFIPKIRLSIAISTLEELSTNLSSLSNEIQNLIDTLKNEGKDVSSLEQLFDDMTSRIQAINTTLLNDKTKLASITLSTSDATPIFVEVRQDLAKVRSEFAKIRYDIAQMRADFKIVLKTSKGASVTP